MAAKQRTQKSRGRGKASPNGAFVLSHVDVAEVLGQVTLGDFLQELTEEIFATYQDPKLESFTRTGWPRPPDTLEVMGCQSTDYTCVKLISSNPSRRSVSVPTVTGTLVCTEVGSDQARLVCDGAILTSLRTAASTVVALNRLAPNYDTLGIIGSGLEGTTHAVVLAILQDNLREIVLLDTAGKQADRAAREIRQQLKREKVPPNRVQIRCVDAVSEVLACDVVVTATYGMTAVVRNRDGDNVHDGTVIAAVGADLIGKRELDFDVYDDAKFVADDVAQCLREGELQHAAGRLRTSNEHDSHRGSLADGRIVGIADMLDNGEDFLKRAEPITVYDSTGFSGQDLALARVLLRRLEKGSGKYRRDWNPSKSLSLKKLLGQ